MQGEPGKQSTLPEDLQPGRNCEGAPAILRGCTRYLAVLSKQLSSRRTVAPNSLGEHTVRDASSIIARVNSQCQQGVFITVELILAGTRKRKRELFMNKRKRQLFCTNTYLTIVILSITIAFLYISSCQYMSRLALFQMEKIHYHISNY